jgi:hypothetical protein
METQQIIQAEAHDLVPTYARTLGALALAITPEESNAGIEMLAESWNVQEQANEY